VVTALIDSGREMIGSRKNVENRVPDYQRMVYIAAPLARDQPERS